MTGSSPAGNDIATVSDMSPSTVQKFAQMATMIPSEDGDAVENILQAILNAASWDQLDKPWEASGAAKLEGVVFRIDSVIRRPSRYRDGMGVFLVVHCLDGKTGETFTWTTSSAAVCAQLIVLYAKNWLPMWATVIVAERETEAGYKPHHLHLYGPTDPREAAA
jgi:hypothetical protein